MTFSPVEWGHSLSGAPVSSGCIATQAVLVRRWCGVAPEIDQPPLDHHYVTLHMGGPKRIRRRGEGAEAHGDIAEGAYSLTPAGAAFQWRTVGPVDFAHVYLTPALIDRVITTEFDRDPRRVSLNETLGARDPMVEALLAAIATGLSNPMRPTDAYWNGVLHTLVHRLVERHSTVAATSRVAPHVLAPARVRRAVEFISGNLTRDIGVADMASAAGVSVFHFSRGFHHATGQSPHHFLVGRRIEHAQGLLADPDVSLAEVARASGFGSHGRFSTVFRREVGVSPGRYRRSL